MIILHGTLLRDEFLLWAETDATSFMPAVHDGSATSAHGTADQSSLTAESRLTYTEPTTSIHDILALLPFAATYSALKEALAQCGLALPLVRRQNAQALAWLPSFAQAALASSPMIGRAIENLGSEADQTVLQP